MGLELVALVKHDSPSAIRFFGTWMAGEGGSTPVTRSVEPWR